jgi:predicted PurR-regulated permease PerM
MALGDHVRTTGSALRRWFIATLQDAAAVGLMWFGGLLILRVPLALLWALIGALCQFIPGIGPVIAVIGPALATLFSSQSDALYHLAMVFMLYAIIAVVDGVVLQPYLMRRSNRVPVWASILAPIVLGFIIPFWGVLLAPPLLAVVYAFRKPRAAGGPPPQAQA